MGGASRRELCPAPFRCGMLRYLPTRRQYRGWCTAYAAGIGAMPCPVLRARTARCLVLRVRTACAVLTAGTAYAQGGRNICGEGSQGVCIWRKTTR
eukprot:1727246-Rhodomonas_salina.1